MNILKVRNYLLASGLALVGAGAMAQSATITFNGTVNAQTCVITASTTSGTTAAVNSLTITLPTVSNGQLNSGSTVGKTVFYMGVSGCLAGAAGVTHTPKLYLSSSSASGGYLSTGITNLVLELLDKNSSSISLTSTPTAFPNSSFSYTGVGALTTYENAFYIQYRASGGAVTATGAITPVAMNVVLQYS